MKNKEKDILKLYFDNMKVESPSLGFEAKLMQKIEREVQKQRRVKQRMLLLYSFIGLLFITLSTYLVIYYINDEPFKELLLAIGSMFKQTASISLNFSILTLLVPLISLSLLDLLFREFYHRRKDKKQST